MTSGYKQTEVGVIPEEWNVANIESIIDEISMGPFGSDITVSNFVSSGVPVLNGANVMSERLVDSFENFVTPAKARSLKKAVAHRGDVVVTHRGTIGQIAYIPEDSAFDRYVISQSQFRARFSPNAVIPAWVVLYFHSDNGGKRLLEGKGHTGVPAIAQPTRTFRKLSIPVPPLPEQSATAEALSDVDALLDGLDRLIAKKRDLKQAAMQQLLTGQTRLPGFSGKWMVKRLGDLGSILKGSGVTKDQAASGGLACIRYGELYTHHNDVIRRYVSWISPDVAATATRLCCGDILFAGSGETKAEIGKCAAFVDEVEAYAGGDVVILRPSGSAPVFLGYLLNSPSIGRQKASRGQGDAVVHISASALADIQCLMPQEREQSAIAAVLSDMDAEIVALEMRRDKTRVLKQAMMQELLTGRTRLVKAATEAPSTGQIAEFPSTKHKRRNRRVREMPPASKPRPNVYFMRAVLAAEIIDELHEESTFGHVKFEKLMFLAERLCNIDTGSTYHRDAAGPYDNRALRSIDSQLRKQKWYDARRTGGRYRYVPMKNRGGHEKYFESYFQTARSTFDRIIRTFKTADTERCEVVATLFAAWEDLIRQRRPVTDQAILHEVLNNWHESKRRIPEDRWRKALGWMRDKGFVPELR